MKLLHLSPVLCACLVACGEAETAANSTTSPDANAAPTMKTVSFAGDHGASTANDPKTGTVNPFGGNGSANSDPSPKTRIVERTGIDPKTKTISPFGGKSADGKESKLTADGVTPSSTPGTRKATEVGKVKTGTVTIGGDKSEGKPAKSTKEKPSKGTDSKDKPAPDSKDKPSKDSKEKPTKGN